jgi:outer membrane protein assembly factor BamA
MRARGFKSWGDYPDFMYFGGNSEMRGYDYLEFVGQNAFFLNAELRFPFIEAMLTPIGILGGVRGVFFANVGGANWDTQPFKAYSREPEIVRPIVDFDRTTLQPILDAPRVIDGFRLVDARASYGVGLETFALGFPIHFDWSWKTLFNKDWEDALFSLPCSADGQRNCGGSSGFRKAKFAVWIGYDF